jgi:hypothetical protein
LKRGRGNLPGFHLLVAATLLTTGRRPIDAIMAAQRDLVEIVYELKQVVCVKG